jgi:hypothetical protein
MKRPLEVALVAVIAVVGMLVALPRDPTPAPAAVSNSGGHVASDVALLASTGRPQPVEVFHYG